jgi:hypothetical protein
MREDGLLSKREDCGNVRLKRGIAALPLTDGCGLLARVWWPFPTMRLLGRLLQEVSKPV